MDEKKIQKFLEWLPTKFEEFKGKTLEEVAEDLNRLYETDEGKQTIQTLMNTFLEEQDKDPSKFANGGILPTSKLDYIVSLHKKGGKLKTKKCSCGCEMHKVFENGGVVEKCACGCDTKKIVKAENGTLISCGIKGKYRLKGVRTTNPVAVGDNVTVELNEEEADTGTISKIDERRNYIIPNQFIY